MISDKFRYSLKDLYKTITNLKIITFFALSDTKAKYKRSMIGPFWITINTLFATVGLGILWGSLMKQEYHTIIPSLSVGLVVWYFLSGIITESTSTYVRNSFFIKNLKLPIFYFPFMCILRHIIVLLHNLLIIILVLLIFNDYITIYLLLVIPGFILVLLNISWICCLISLIGTRFRDLEQIINSLMPLVFFMSPILYRSSQLEVNTFILWLNPMSYFISLLRDPILGHHPSLSIYAITFCTGLFGWLITLFIYNNKRNSLVFWI